MSETQYTRNGKIISSVEKKPNGEPLKVFHCDSISKAKRKSRELQLNEDGALGRGFVARR